MAGTTAEAQVAKRCYKNQTAGWLGVVKLDHLGAQVGAPVKPFGTVYLSDAEAVLTARAPADPKDNPFEEQMFMFVDSESGQHVEKAMRPLILLQDSEGVPSEERYVPSGDINPEKLVAEHARTEAALDAQESDPRTVPSAPEEPTQVAAQPAFAVEPGHSGPAEEVADENEGKESWVENPDRTAEPQRGSLGGSQEPAPQPVQGDAASPQGESAAAGQQTPPPQAPAPTTVASQHGSVKPSESAGTGEAAGAPSEQEEHAGVTKSGEETGAADRPTGDAPEGEYAQHEEVGSPDAPSAEAS